MLKRSARMMRVNDGIDGDCRDSPLSDSAFVSIMFEILPLRRDRQEKGAGDTSSFTLVLVCEFKVALLVLLS